MQAEVVGGMYDDVEVAQEAGTQDLGEAVEETGLFMTHVIATEDIDITGKQEFSSGGACGRRLTNLFVGCTCLVLGAVTDSYVRPLLQKRPHEAQIGIDSKRVQDGDGSIPVSTAAMPYLDMRGMQQVPEAGKEHDMSYLDDLRTGPFVLEDMYANFAIIGCGMLDDAECLKRFKGRVISARKKWARSLTHFYVTAEYTQTIKKMLTAAECAASQKHSYKDVSLTSSQTGKTYKLWTCSGEGYEPFDVLLTSCTPDKNVLNRHDAETRFATACRWSASVDFVKNVMPKNFRHMKWLGIGDDDMGFDFQALTDFLGHYDFKDKIVLNPASSSNVGQNQPAHTWLLSPRLCNRFLPQKFMTSIFSRGGLEAAGVDLAGYSTEAYCRGFGPTSYDIVLGLIFWMHDFKFVPIRGRLALQGPASDPTGPNGLLVHMMREMKDHDYMENRHKQLYPRAERLIGEWYNETYHFKAGAPTEKLDMTNCRPEGKPEPTEPLCNGCPKCPEKFQPPVCQN